MDESQLITACKNQDRGAQEVLYKRYAPKMMAVCLRYCKDYDTAKDLLHDSFLQVYTQIDSYAGKGSFEGWMRRIFVNVALENFRKNQRAQSFQKEYADTEVESSVEQQEDALEIGDVPREAIMQIIQNLPDGYRTVFNLVIFEEMSHNEIAQQLGITAGASRSQFFRARQIVQKKVQEILNKDYL